MQTTAHTDIGERILVWGSSCSGKSTLAEELANHLQLEFVDLDALNWLPNWQGLNATDPERLEARIRQATITDRWVVAGSYTQQSQVTFWPQLQTIVWLDLPLPILIYRVLTRSWQRWRNQELLWGTNYENFWDQLKVWRGEDSLLWWVVTQYRRKRRQSLAFIADPKWAHIRWLHIRTPADLAAFKTRLGINVS